ncbi:MAG: alpha/beta hydrolase [Spirochaetes bacterium]|nr:alpha/beta hydrolase [Spirochaetota bacterium]
MGFKLSIFSIIIALAVTSCVSTPAFKDKEGKALEGSIAVIEKVPIGGIDQWLFIRGEDASRPVLLFLHGGPGSPEASLVRAFCPDLERIFMVVHWEQRMSGKSYSGTTPGESITVDQYVRDTLELTEYLRKRFERDKIYLMGHSWGSILGVLTVKRDPRPYHAFIGIGQVVHQLEGEEISYDYVMSKAKENKDKRAIRRLEKIGRPPYPQERIVSSLWKERKLVIKYGGAFYSEENRKKIMRARYILCQEEYNFSDKINWIRGQVYLCRNLFDKILAIDLREAASKLEVPAYFFQGIHDYQTPAVLVKDYFGMLDAPRKELFLFENSAHSPIFEEPERFIELVRDTVLKGR